MIQEECIDVAHEEGVNLISDALTKVLNKEKLCEARSRLRLVQE